MNSKSLVGILIASSTLFGASKLSEDLQNLPSSAKLDVIVQFLTAPGTSAINSVTGPGGSLKHQMPGINGAMYTLPAAAIAGLEKNPHVKFATPNRKLKGHLEFAEPTTNANIALQYGYDGTGVGVALLDSGVLSSHPDLAQAGTNTSRVVYSQSFVAGDTSTSDAYGHGTHVAGIIGGNGAVSSGTNVIYTFRGIAPKVNIVNLRVLDANGEGTDAGVIDAINQAIQLKSQYNIRVLNLSLGRQVMESYATDPLCQAVEQAWNAGIVVVVAAGNNGHDNSHNTFGYDTITSPGNDPRVITVGAMRDMGSVSRSDDLVASYSSKGPTLIDHVAKPDLVAPGNGIISALAGNSAITTKYPNNVVPLSYYRSSNSGAISNQYFKLSGTSMAAPMVSGAAALLIQKDSLLSPDTVKARLMKTATKNFPASSSVTDPTTGTTYTSYYDMFTIGAGYLDVWAARNSSDVGLPGSSAGSRAVVYD